MRKISDSEKILKFLRGPKLTITLPASFPELGYTGIDGARAYAAAWRPYPQDKKEHGLVTRTTIITMSFFNEAYGV